MFGFASSKIDFNIIDSVKLILVKIDFKLKWFMFGYIQGRSPLWAEQGHGPPQNF
jgi:hypothetical protein